LFCELLKLFCLGEEVTRCCVDVDAHVVAVLRRLPKTFGRVAEKAETGEEAVDAMMERQSESPGGGEEEEVVHVRKDFRSAPPRVP
jgi:hypothetical protein